MMDGSLSQYRIGRWLTAETPGRLCFVSKIAIGAEAVAQRVEGLPGMCEGLGSIPQHLTNQVW